MFRPIRRTKNEISTDAAKQLLKKERRAVLAVNGDDGYPYAVPMNFLYCEEDGKIYFHGSRTGHKIDSLKKNDKVCLTVYGNETFEKDSWAPCVQSVIVFGRCCLMEDRERAAGILRKLAEKYYPDQETVEEEMNRSGAGVQMLELTVEHLSGKQIRER